MRRKFKHKVTDWKAIESGFADQHYKIYNAIDDYEGHLSFGMVENSNDWQEITQEPILVTEDGYELNYGDKYYMVSETFKVQEKRLSKATLFSSAARRFYYQENAEAYIERHKLRYSNKDLDYLRQEVKNACGCYANEHQIEDIIVTAIINLKESKND